MLLSFVITSSWVRAQISDSQSSDGNTNDISKGDTIKQFLDNKYLRQLGLTFNVTQISSLANLQNADNIKGYSYTGNFSSSDQTFFVQASQLETTNGNQTISSMTETISGSTCSYIYETVNKTISGNQIIIQDLCSIQTSNSTGTYCMNMSSIIIMDVDTSLISANSQFEQNMSDPIGNYSVVVTSQPTTTEIVENKVADDNLLIVVTMPNGSQETVGTSLVTVSSIVSPNSDGISEDILSMDSPPQFGSVLFSPAIQYLNGYLITGGYIYWSPGYTIDIGIALGILSGLLVLIGALSGPGGLVGGGIAAGILLAVGGTALAEAGMVMSVAGGYQYYWLYFELIVWLALGVIPIPSDYEVGYYGNQITSSLINNGQPYITPYWAYYSLWDLTYGWLTHSDILQYNHTSVWPSIPQPILYGVIFLAYDESALTTMGKIPFAIDGNWALVTSSTPGYPTYVTMPAGTHTIQVPNPQGAFDHFVVYDQTHSTEYSVYSDPSNITLSGFTTITARYHHSISDSILVVGACPALYSVALAAVAATGGSDCLCVIPRSNDAVYSGVRTGDFGVGMVDRAPTLSEWQSTSNLQVWALGYNGIINTGNPYTATKVLWAVTKGTPQAGTGDSVKAVWISYLRLPDPTNLRFMGDYYKSPHPNFITQAGYLTLGRDNFAGGPVITNQGQTYIPHSGQTQVFPDYTVSATDLFYFAAAYGDVTHVNPYADMDANGRVSPNDIFMFLSNFGGGGGSAKMDSESGDDQEIVPSGFLSAVQAGTNDTSVWSVGPDPDPINSTIRVAVRVNNASNVWGWAIEGLTWNSSVLNLTRIQEGSYLNGGYEYNTLFMGGSESLWDNVNGTISRGIACAFSGGDYTASANSGVICTLTFVVVGYGTSEINLFGAYLRASSNDGNGIAIIANNATITVLAPQ
jgi:hypothetical protein